MTRMALPSLRAMDFGETRCTCAKMPSIALSVATRLFSRCVISASEVVAVGVPDEPGGLSRLLQLLAERQIDVQYMYSIFGQPNGMAYMILRVADPAEVSSLLHTNGMQLAGAAELGIVSSDQERQE